MVVINRCIVMRMKVESKSKRVRRPRCIISWRDTPGVNMLNMTDYLLLSNSVDYRKPETYQQKSLLCAEAPKWRLARKRELHALFERPVVWAVPTHQTLDL